jgi:serine/threonine protein kinase
MEQNYDKFGPWTDFYALGATLYTLLTNKRPPLPTDIDDDISEDKHLALPLPNGVSKEMKSNILWLMQTNRNKRPQSIDEFISKMKEVGKPAPSSVGDAKKDSTISSEETIIADNEKTIIDVSPAKKPIKEPQTVVPQTKKYSTPVDNLHNKNNNYKEGNSKGVGLIVLGAFIFIILLGVYFSKSQSGNNSASAVALEDTAAVDTAVVDTAFVENMVYDSPLGKYTYTGCAVEGIPEGEGEARFKDGRYYKGFFKYGSLSGDNALFVYPNGDEYRGSFKDNMFDQGTYTIKSSGEYFRGTYKDGNPLHGKWFDKDGNLIEEI